MLDDIESALSNVDCDLVRIGMSVPVELESAFLARRLCKVDDHSAAARLQHAERFPAGGSGPEF
ncbi:hypothetical protein [Bradyrhizobium jicamae]|uniref:hypothetical protein n=1 Tax=Bradyrhizobium jicamae TaxID=280332 RepID=UPI0012ED59D5|nr:hypothetical protein [Bradyrhizobium jicamae]